LRISVLIIKQSKAESRDVSLLLIHISHEWIGKEWKNDESKEEVTMRKRFRCSHLTNTAAVWRVSEAEAEIHQQQLATSTKKAVEIERRNVKEKNSG
jgi:hypothetical protein